MPKVSLRIGQAEVYVPLQQLEKATRQLSAGQNLTPQPNPEKQSTLATLAGDMLNLVELKLGSNFAGLGSAMIVGRKQFLPQDRWAANALRGLHEAVGFTRHFTDLGEQAWRTKVAEAIARMESKAHDEAKEENLQEPNEGVPYHAPKKHDQQHGRPPEQQQITKATKSIVSCSLTEVPKCEQNDPQEISDTDIKYEYISLGLEDDHANHAKSKVTDQAHSKGSNHFTKETDANPTKGEAIASKSMMNFPAYDAKAIVITTKSKAGNNHWDEAIFSEEKGPSPKLQAEKQQSQEDSTCTYGGIAIHITPPSTPKGGIAHAMTRFVTTPEKVYQKHERPHEARQPGSSPRGVSNTDKSPSCDMTEKMPVPVQESVITEEQITHRGNKSGNPTSNPTKSSQ